MKSIVWPQCYTLTTNNQFLYVIGADHKYDISHPQFKVIKTKWQEFLKKTKGQNCIVLVEGGKRPIVDDLTEAVTHWGEGGFITSLAAKESIETYSPEPDDVDEVNELLKKFTRDQIMLYYFNRLLAQWQNTGKLVEFRDYIQRYFDTYQQLMGWKGYDFDINHFITIHDKGKGHKFNENNCKYCLYELDFDLEDVENNSAKIRDEHILKEIIRLWKQGKNIFIVYGGAHTENWESKLKKL